MKTLLKSLFVTLTLTICMAGIAQQSYTVRLTKKGTNDLIDLTSKSVSIQIISPNKNATKVSLQNSGIYKFTANINDTFRVIDDLTYEVYDFKLGKKLNLQFDIAEEKINKVIYESAKFTQYKLTASSRNYWVGANVAYNLNGKAGESVVGGSKLIINPSNIFGENNNRHYLNLIGNIGTFFSNTDNKENEAAINKLMRSETGLGLGLGYIYEFIEPNEKFNARAEMTTNYRLNSFKDPTYDTATIALDQWRTTLLYEMELGNWGKKGIASLSFEGSLSVFSSSVYEQIFKEKRSKRLAFETTLILPISENVGFLMNFIATEKMKPVYQFGVTIKTNK